VCVCVCAFTDDPYAAEASTPNPGTESVQVYPQNVNIRGIDRAMFWFTCIGICAQEMLLDYWNVLGITFVEVGLQYKIYNLIAYAAARWRFQYLS